MQLIHPLWIKRCLVFICLLTLTSYSYANASTNTARNNAMQPVQFTCVLEKDHNPPLDPEADKYFQQARALEKTNGWEDWAKIVEFYNKAIEMNHWKAMNNLAAHYRKGEYAETDKMDHPTGIKKDPAKAVELYKKMVELNVPMGYYNMAIAIGRGEVPKAKRSDAGLFMIKAAELGYAPAQVALGNHYAFGLPRDQQRSDIAEQYFKCAGKQDNVEALIQVAEFYEVDKENKPLAAYYYQKAASLGSYKGMMTIADLFGKNAVYNFGYLPDESLKSLYEELLQQLDNNPELAFPNLMKDHPLPRHPTQGYDAENPDVRPSD